MAVLGGATWLTGSGLSMVNWHPIHGTIPPLTSAQWDEKFSFYQQWPEFWTINHVMYLDEFKSIFWWRKKVKPSLTPKLLMMFVLGGFQGLLGWYMVKNGLVNNPHVSQYRLTAQWVSAISIYGFILWTWLDLRYPKSLHGSQDQQLNRWCQLCSALSGATDHCVGWFCCKIKGWPDF
jgi:cytochrome c oxidase assembly protein subunit 15